VPLPLSREHPSRLALQRLRRAGAPLALDILR